MLGYLFQIERVMFWLSELKSGGFVGVECGDDIVVKKNVNEENEVYEQDNRLITQYSNRPFIEKLPISSGYIKRYRTENFVKKLEKIDADDNEKIMAINDYLRASSEKTRFAKEANYCFTVFTNSKVYINYKFRKMKKVPIPPPAPNGRESKEFKLSDFARIFTTIIFLIIFIGILIFKRWIFLQLDKNNMSEVNE